MLRRNKSRGGGGNCQESTNCKLHDLSFFFHTHSKNEETMIVRKESSNRRPCRRHRVFDPTTTRTGREISKTSVILGSLSEAIFSGADRHCVESRSSRIKTSTTSDARHRREMSTRVVTLEILYTLEFQAPGAVCGTLFARFDRPASPERLSLANFL
jgi:hypothetical protein